MDAEHTRTTNVEVRPSEMLGGGMGLFALRRFEAGDVVHMERPFLSIPGLDWVSIEEALCETSLSNRLIQKAVSDLSPESRALFWTFGAAPIYGQTATAQGIVWTNMIDIDPENNPGGHVFAMTCRLNHSCEPNIDWKLNKRTRLLESSNTNLCIALRDIEEGEELLTDYTSGVQDPSKLGYVEQEGWGYGMKSREYLRVWFGFDCTCSKCRRDALAGAPAGVAPQVLGGIVKHFFDRGAGGHEAVHAADGGVL